jgi:hypothetical protein
MSTNQTPGNGIRTDLPKGPPPLQEFNGKDITPPEDLQVRGAVYSSQGEALETYILISVAGMGPLLLLNEEGADRLADLLKDTLKTSGRY